MAGRMQPNIRFYDTIARFYDAENATYDEDLPLYESLLDNLGRGSALVVGCGTGRLLLALARMGCRVTGIDLSAPMLARIEGHLDREPSLRGRVTVVQADARDMPVRERFKLIAIPFNTFMHFIEQEDQLAVLEACRDRLEDDGLLVIDLPNATDAYGSQDEDGLMVLERTFFEPESRRQVMQQSVSAIDRATQRLNITWIYDELGEDGTVRRTMAPLVLRYVFPAEAELLLHVAGLRLLEMYGDYDQGPFESGAPRMILVAEKRAGETA
jgi:SAM-dependent methyltransferase